MEQEGLKKPSKKLHLEDRAPQSLGHISYFPFSFLAFKTGQAKMLQALAISGATGLWNFLF